MAKFAKHFDTISMIQARKAVPAPRAETASEGDLEARRDAAMDAARRPWSGSLGSR